MMLVSAKKRNRNKTTRKRNGLHTAITLRISQFNFRTSRAPIEKDEGRIN